jgi:hypothetical protein
MMKLLDHEEPYIPGDPKFHQRLRQDVSGVFHVWREMHLKKIPPIDVKYFL